MAKTETATATAETYDPMAALMARIDALVGIIATNQNQPASGDPNLTLALTSQVEALKELGAQYKRTVRQDNADHLHVSDFSYPEGDLVRPKPTLKYETWFCGFKEREDALKPEEIELYNAFDSSRTARKGKWTAKLEQRGDKYRLLIEAPVSTTDDRADLPPLTVMLSELLYGEEVVDPSKTMALIADLKRQVAELAART